MGLRCCCMINQACSNEEENNQILIKMSSLMLKCQDVRCANYMYELHPENPACPKIPSQSSSPLLPPSSFLPITIFLNI